MIDFDYGPVALLLPIGLAFVLPFLYGFFVDHYDKKTPPIVPPLSAPKGKS